MKINAKSMALAIVATFVVGIGVSQIVGYWKMEGSKTPVAIKEGEFAGLPNPADIRGSYTWEDLGKAFKFDPAWAMTAFGVTDPASKLNTLETVYSKTLLPLGTEIGTGSVRYFVSLITGIPLEAEADNIFPITAIPVLREHSKADPALIDALEAKAFRPGQAAAPAAAPAPEAAGSSAPAATPKAEPAPVVAPAPTAPAASAPAAADVAHAPMVGAVTGKTSFKDLKDWGLDEAKIKSATDGKIGKDGDIVKDWASARGLTFSELKTKLQDLLAAAGK
ncbi:MAG: hypothetical protein FD137_2157 [Spirochaetes bacterium]|nr:MAG: hypothetical protein FD137_2157 [Spirochaetota bacterium]